MSGRGVTPAGRAALASLASWFAGCPSAGIYSSPRTLPPGTSQHGVIVETFALNRGHGLTRTDGGGVVPVPTMLYALRYGLTPRLEVGGRVGLGALGADLKFGLVRSRWIDLAVDPGVLVGYGRNQGETFPGVVLNLPAFVGLNASPRLQVILGGRFALGVPLRGTVETHNQRLSPGYGGEAVVDAIHLAFGGAATGGFVGLRIALGEGDRGVALQPAYDVLVGLAGDGFVVHSFGLGVTFGANPLFP